MEQRQKTLTSSMIYIIVFATLFNLDIGTLALNIGREDFLFALVFFFLPIVFAVYNISTDPDPLPIYIKSLALYTSSVFLIDEVYNFGVKLFTIFGGESLAEYIWVFRFSPFIVWLIITLIMRSKRVNLVSARKFLLFFVTIQFVMVGIMIGYHYFELLLTSTETQLLVKNKPQIVNLLMTIVPFSYLVFYKFDSARFKRVYKTSIFSAVIMAFILISLAVGEPIYQNFDFDHTVYLYSLYVNYPFQIAFTLAVFEAFTRLFISIFVYVIVVDRFKQVKGSVSTFRVFTLFVVLLCVFYSLALRNVTEMATFIEIDTNITFLTQLIYMLVITCYGFYVSLRKFSSPSVKMGLFIAPSLAIIYVIYNIETVLPGVKENYLHFLGTIDNFFLIFSLLIIILYSLETWILWYAYTKNSSTDDLGPIPIQKELDMYIMIPCMNEELVIGSTLTSILLSNYKNLNVVVIDDASEDRTAEVVREFDDPRLRLIQRVKPNAQQGKGEALNYVYYMLKDEIEAAGKNFDDVLIAIIDADTILPLEYFEHVNYAFNYQPEITGLQSKVRVISNNDDRAQDLEFAKIINSTQTLRAMTNTVAFGGNGQFCKLSALDGLGEEPWSKSLVEDFDLSTRLFLSDQVAAKHAQYDDIYIVQSGIEDDDEALVKQRVRWSQGNIQSSKYILPIIKSKQLAGKQKIELSWTLLKPWLMGIEYVIVIYTIVTIIDLLLLGGITPTIVFIISMFMFTLLYILFNNLIWSILYNRHKPGKFNHREMVIDAYYLTRFLLVLSQIYPQSAIRHFKSENGWDKTKRKQTSL